MEKPNTTHKKLSEYSNRTIKSNLIKWIDFANEEQIEAGKFWYYDAKLFCKETAELYKIDAYTVATVVSCLSPNNKWEQNKKDTIATLNYFMSLNFIRGGKVSRRTQPTI